MKTNLLARFAWLLILGTAACIVVVAVAVVRASSDTAVRPGLDYGHFLAALDDLIDGVPDSSLIRFDEVDAAVGRERVTYDTLVVVADAEAFPGFQRGGFLHDQARVYNRFQRERLALARSQPEWFERLAPHNPSIFRSYREAGNARLSRAGAAWSLRVRSPAEEEWDGEIRARDVHRGNGLMGARVTVPLRKPVRLTRRVDGRRQLCDFTPNGIEVHAYCLSEERIPQAVFRMASEESGPGSAQAGWIDLWVDGGRVSSGDSVPLRDGAVLGIDPLEPVVFGELWEGVLSGKQWISGRMRRTSAFAPPLDLFAALGSRASVAAPGTSSNASVDLSVSGGASIELTERLQAFIDDRVDEPLDFGIIVIGRVPDGEILAVAEVGNRRSRGRSNLLERITPGSAVKPLLAAAVLSERPELADLRIPARNGSVRSVLGLPSVPARRAFRTNLNCSAPGDGWIDLTFFLRCSNNEYAAALLAAGLAEGLSGVPSGASNSQYELNGRRIRGERPELAIRGTAVSRATLLRSPLSEGLSRLFDVPVDPVIADSTGRSDRVWNGLAFSDGTRVRVPYELLPTESRPALLAPDRPTETDLGLLYRYAIGAWENGWNLLDLTTGFGRVVTDRRFQLTFVPQAPASSAEAGEDALDESVGSTASQSAEVLGLRDMAWYDDFMEGLGRVGTDGTARGLSTRWRRDGLRGTLYAKTGTLAEPGEAGPADDLFLKSLLFAVGDEAEASGGALECGIVGGMYLRFAEGPSRGSLPSHQIRFAERELGAFLRDHWEQFGVCGDDGAGRP